GQRRDGFGARHALAPPEGPQDGLETGGGDVELGPLDGHRRVDMLGAGHRALPDEGAVPGAPVDAQDGPALVPPLVPGIEVVTVGQGDGRRADEVVVQAEHGAGGVAEHAVDAHAELLVGLDLLGVWRYSPSETDCSSSRTIQGLTSFSFSRKALMSTTRSRITGK